LTFSGVESKLIPFPSNSITSKIKWHLEKNQLIFNCKNSNFGKILKNEIQNFDPDIIHCQFAYESCKLLHNYVPNCPVILNFRGYGASSKLKNKKYVNWLREILKLKNIYAVFVSNSLKLNLENHNITFKNEPKVLYTGVNLDKFKRVENSVSEKNTINENEKFVFTQVGSFNEKKGQELTIKAFKEFLLINDANHFILKFIGEGKNLKKCMKLVSELELSKNVRFLGKMDQNQIVEELKMSNVFVHHSITPPNGDQEGIPNSIIEAMAMELPILSTQHSGIPEAVEHGLNGLLCNEYDIKHYANNMNSIKDWKLLKINREKVIKQFNLDNHLINLKTYYNEILRNYD
jgi:glycosyltransferase involved in cell wall biosynthesis